MPRPLHGPAHMDHSTYSTRQRTIVVTFATPADAEDWDTQGQPLDGSWLWAEAFPE